MECSLPYVETTDTERQNNKGMLLKPCWELSIRLDTNPVAWEGLLLREHDAGDA